MNLSEGVTIGVFLIEDDLENWRTETQNENQEPSSSVVSGRRLCFALRWAGRATSSGFARERGCPGGATGLRMLSNTGIACDLFVFGGELRLAIFSLHSDVCGTGAMLAPPQNPVNKHTTAVS